MVKETEEEKREVDMLKTEDYSNSEILENEIMKDTMKKMIIFSSCESGHHNHPLSTTPTPTSPTTSTTTSSSLLPIEVNPSDEDFFSSQALKDAIFEWQEQNLKFFLPPNEKNHLYEEDAELITHAMHPVQDDEMILWRIGEPCDHTDKRFLSTAKTINGCWAAISSRYNNKMKLMKFHVSKEVKRLDLTQFPSHHEHREEKEVVLQSHLSIRYLKTVPLDYDDRIEVEYKQRHHTFLEYEEYQVTPNLTNAMNDS